MAGARGAQSTVERRAARDPSGRPGLTPERLIAGFLAPPFYSRRSSFPTVYTAVYRPQEGGSIILAGNDLVATHRRVRDR